MAPQDWEQLTFPGQQLRRSTGPLPNPSRLRHSHDYPGHDQRMEKYSERAAKKLPLFD